MNNKDISLFMPSLNGQTQALKSLLEQGQNPNQFDEVQQTPLLVAISKGHYNVAKLLLEHGANPNIPNTQGQTPLFLAASEGNLAVVQLLLKFGANPNQPTRYGNTPLYIAAVSRNYTITKLLLEQEDKNVVSTHPFFIILKRLNAHALTLLNQARMYHHESASHEEAREYKIQFLILLMEILKQGPLVSIDETLTAAFSLENRFKDKIFSHDNHTRRLFEITLRCICTGSTYAFETQL